MDSLTVVCCNDFPQSVWEDNEAAEEFIKECNRKEQERKPNGNLVMRKYYHTKVVTFVKKGN